jgi:hypothetical protein
MQTVYIRFLTEEDRVRGSYELIRHSRVGSFPGQVYKIPMAALKLLEDLHIDFREATDAEVRAANGQVRNTCPALL